jgi:tetratricopeptide (TPR) repeat protein
MNTLKNILTFMPALYTYLKGVTFFHRRDYEIAIQKFEKCLKHPKFQNEQLFSFYGQALCAADRLEEARGYLLKACEFYRERSWVFEKSIEYNLAKKTISALKYICEHSDNDAGREYFDISPQIKEV